jgi:A/G-specific adenine glycosylase
LIPGQHAVPSIEQKRGRHLLTRSTPDHPVDARADDVGHFYSLGGTTGISRDQIKEQTADRTSDFGRTRAEAVPDAAPERTAVFVTAVWEHYRRCGRDLPWRHAHDPYEILVSEVMLQQTQVARVLVKYPEFLSRFPTAADLATASLSDLLTVWSGLGYNRRAVALQKVAAAVVTQYHGRLPSSRQELQRLPGIGPATAAAVCVFAYGQPHAFIETNIRAAFIHFFFPGTVLVSDAEILPLVELTLDREDPRTWFYALMDYGVWVKKEHANPSRRSRHHSLQSPLTGSRRELRSQVLRALLALVPSSSVPDAIQAMLPGSRRPLDELASVLEELTREGFLKRDGSGYRIA